MCKCKVEDCDRPVRSRDWCALHYNRWVRYGTVEDFDPVPIYRAPGVSEELVEKYKDIAGDGNLDDKCRRIVEHWRDNEPIHRRDDPP